MPNHYELRTTNFYNPPVARFFAPTLTSADETIALDDDEASHLVRVLRIEPGREVRVFNGHGLERMARVELADKRGVVLRIVGDATAAAELPFPVVLAQSVLKGDAMDQVIRDAVMLGVTAIAPIVSAHTEGSLSHIQKHAACRTLGTGGRQLRKAVRPCDRPRCRGCGGIRRRSSTVGTTTS